jgi:hypothetical protein
MENLNQIEPQALKSFIKPILAELVQEFFPQIIENKISEKISETLAEFVKQNEQKAKEISLIERILRVEEELKALREVEQTRFETLYKEMNVKFEALYKETNARFEILVKGLEALEKKFNFLQWLIAIGFSFIACLITIVNFIK